MSFFSSFLKIEEKKAPNFFDAFVFNTPLYG